MSAEAHNRQFTCPITPRYREIFYSSIEPSWEDPVESVTDGLPTARATFEPPDSAPITIDGKVVT